MGKLDLRSAAFGNAGLASMVLALLIPAIPHAVGETKNVLNKSAYEVTGHVRLFHASSTGNAEDDSEVAVWLVPAQTVQNVRLSTQLPHYRMAQHHKVFEPRLLVVPSGSIVEFRNLDPWYHNVFSVSANSRFDVGFYEPGVQKTVRFDRAGASYLFCGIHSEMMAVVLTVDSAYFGVSDKAGHISIRNVPPGKYFLHVWHDHAAPQTLAALQRAVFVGDYSHSMPAISIALSNRISMSQFLDANGSSR